MANEVVPEWGLEDRLRRSLRHAGVTPGQMARYLEVHSNTVSNWLAGRKQPDSRTLRVWALRCGVVFEWLRYGGDPGNWQRRGIEALSAQHPELRVGFSGEADLDGREVCAVRDSNPEPADYWLLAA